MPPNLAAPSTRWSSDCHVQPFQLVPAWDRGNHIDPRHSDLVRAMFVCELLRPKPSDSLQASSRTHSAELSRHTVAHTVVYGFGPWALLTCQRVVSSFILKSTAFADSAFFDTETQSSSDCSLPFAVQHPTFGRSSSPSGSNSLSPVCQESSFLKGVHCRREFVRSDDLVFFFGSG